MVRCRHLKSARPSPAQELRAALAPGVPPRKQTCPSATKSCEVQLCFVFRGRKASGEMQKPLRLAPCLQGRTAGTCGRCTELFMSWADTSFHHSRHLKL